MNKLTEAAIQVSPINLNRGDGRQMQLVINAEGPNKQLKTPIVIPNPNKREPLPCGDAASQEANVESTIGIIKHKTTGIEN